MKIEASKAVVSKFLNTRDGMTVDKLSEERIDAAFLGASEIIRASNNAGAVAGTKTNDEQKINAHARGGQEAINRNFWSKQ